MIFGEKVTLTRGDTPVVHEKYTVKWTEDRYEDGNLRMGVRGGGQ